MSTIDLASVRRIHVVVGVVLDDRGHVLIARRAPRSHQGGLWEFPGGKVEAGESTDDTLRRELSEEVGIAVQRSAPLIRIPFDYEDARVLLDVRRVDRFSGTARGREGQPIRWVPPARLRDYPFPAANAGIVAAAGLPPVYAISPEPGEGLPSRSWWNGLTNALADDAPLVQYRARSPGTDHRACARGVVERVHAAGARCLINRDMNLARAVRADGVHLTSAQLAELTVRPSIPLVGASCHSPEELDRAVTLGVDFAVLGPVRVTRSHPGHSPLGWARFAEWVENCPVPVYALGGMGRGDLDVARAARAQGVAGISAFWRT